MHHGVSPTPFAYHYSSANLIFQSQLGKFPDSELLDKRYQHNHVGRNVLLPDNFEMDGSGLILRKNVTAVQQVELLYASPKSFLYYMNRPSDDKWIEEQKSDNIQLQPITMELIEQGVSLTSPKQMLINEKGRNDYNRISDLKLCEEIDRIIVNQYKAQSVYCLPYSQKQELYQIVKELYHVGDAQARRCLAMNY